MKVLVTGSAGFIGFHLIKKLIDLNFKVFGIDNLDSYYDIQLKKDRINALPFKKFKFFNNDIRDINHILNNEEFDVVIHLAAQAGVKYSKENPSAYINSNIIGQFEILKYVRDKKIPLIFASSSSIYGETNLSKTSEEINPNPLSLYATTKYSGEMMAKNFSEIYGIKCVGLRFFTVYGSWGRPDMAYWLFTSKILNDKKIILFDNGEMLRDFTYINDIINGIYLVLNNLEKIDSYEILNIGRGKPRKVVEMVKILEKILGKNAKIEFQPKDIVESSSTFADISKIKKKYKFEPSIDLEDGLNDFVMWYKGYRE